MEFTIKKEESNENKEDDDGKMTLGKCVKNLG